MSDNLSSFEVDAILKRRMKSGRVSAVNFFFRSVRSVFENKQIKKNIDNFDVSLTLTTLTHIFTHFNTFFTGGIFIEMEQLSRPKGQYVGARRKFKLFVAA